MLLNEATIFENAPSSNPPGPAGPGCTRPLEAADVTAPSQPGNFTVFQTSLNQVTLSWTASTDDWYVAGYRIFVDGVAVANTGPLATSYVVTAAPGPHTYAVAAYDTASPRGPGADIITQIASGFGNLYGNLSALSTTGTLDQPDVTAPSVPTDLVAQSGVGVATLTWSAATDDVGVASYGVYRDGLLIGTATSPTYTENGLPIGAHTSTPSTRSTLSATARRSRLRRRPTSPRCPTPRLRAVPTGLTATTSPDIHGRNVVVAWNASTDNVGVTGYSIYRKRVLSPDTDRRSVDRLGQRRHAQLHRRQPGDGHLQLHRRCVRLGGQPLGEVGGRYGASSPTIRRSHRTR